MYYVFNIDKTEIVSISVSYPNLPCLTSDSDIPLVNAKLVDGDLYDDRDIEYWKLLKAKELNEYLTSNDAKGFKTSLEFTADCNEASILKLNLGLSNYNLNAKTDTDMVGFCDYFNQLHLITFIQFKQICKDVGAEYSNRYGKKWTVRDLISKATTIEQIQAIII